jgi:hypothetical protein
VGADITDDDVFQIHCRTQIPDNFLWFDGKFLVITVLIHILNQTVSKRPHRFTFVWF